MQVVCMQVQAPFVIVHGHVQAMIMRIMHMELDMDMRHRVTVMVQEAAIIQEAAESQITCSKPVNVSRQELRVHAVVMRPIAGIPHQQNAVGMMVQQMTGAMEQITGHV